MTTSPQTETSHNTKTLAPNTKAKLKLALTTSALLALLTALVAPVVVQQKQNANLSALKTDLATITTLLISAEYNQAGALGNVLPAEQTATLNDGNTFTPKFTLRLYGSVQEETFCVEGRTSPTSPHWSYDMADGGLQETPCETRIPRG